MKVAMISDWYLPKLGGVEILVHELSKYMDKRPGVEVEVITQDFSKTFSFKDKCSYEDGIKVRRLAGITGPIWKTYFHPELPFKIKRLFKTEDYDVIHTHHLFTLLSVLSTAVAEKMHPRISCIVATNHTYHARSDSLIFKAPKFFASFAGKSADRLLVGSDAAGKIAEDICDPEKIRKINYGVPLDEFNSKKKSKKLRKKIGVNSGIMILYVGRFGKRKGVEYLIQAFKQGEDELEDAKLILIGKGPRKGTYQKLIKKLYLEDKIKIEGLKSRGELEKYYASCDFAVFPSVRDESFGRVIPEAMASGKPYIATEIPGYNEVFEDGTGFLVPPKNPELLSEKMIELHNDNKLRKRFGKRGRKIAIEKFNWNKIVDKILEVYNEVLS